jgi:hypothetical protein
MLQARVPAFNLPIYATFILAPLAEAVLQVAFALIAFTWYEAMTQTKSVPKTFSKMRMPAIICSVIVAGATSIINIVSGALYSTLIIAVTGIIALMFYIVSVTLVHCNFAFRTNLPSTRLSSSYTWWLLLNCTVFCSVPMLTDLLNTARRCKT